MEKKTWCKILGHNWIKHHIDGYLPFIRKCKRCERLEVQVNIGGDNDIGSTPIYEEFNPQPETN